MEELLAALAAFTAFNQFLLTPPGQTMATKANDAVAKVNSFFAEHLHGLLPAPAAAAPIAPPSSTAAAQAVNQSQSATSAGVSLAGSTNVPGDAFAALKKAPAPAAAD